MCRECLPGRVVVVGGGTSGVNAARMATGLGADVTILDVDLERLRYLDLSMNKRKHSLFERGELARADARVRFADRGCACCRAQRRRN